MLQRALLYHDVVPDGCWSSSGFGGGDADIYKLLPADFVDHLDRLRHAGFAPATLGSGRQPAHSLTFDDGGASAVEIIAPELERRGWRGHFFVTTGRIGTPAFLNAAQVRELHARGHVVGSHSVTHPTAMAACPREQLVREWRLSLDHLADLLGTRPAVASIPGGWYSRAVAEAAAASGVRYLYTSEPTPRAWQVETVTCLGRYAIRRGVPPAAVVAWGVHGGLWAVRERATWMLKKVAKRTLQRRYVDLRRTMLDGRAPARHARSGR
jgi:peptidoglycan/xylan/chitin deacetylase (PgdA/CDA1 family)